MKKKIVSLVVSTGLLATIISTAQFFSANADEVPVTLTQAASTVTVTVPTSLPFTVDADGTVRTASTTPSITNSSPGPVDVTAVTATSDTWAILAPNTDVTTQPVNANAFTLTLNGDDFPAAATSTTSTLNLGDDWATIDGTNGTLSLPYSGAFPARSTAVSADTKIASVIITVGWHTGA